MQDDLNILGLTEMPEDRRALRKAYAKTLRTIRADEDPEGFMRLRDAMVHIEFLLEHNIKISDGNEQDETHNAIAVESLQIESLDDAPSSFSPHIFESAPPVSAHADSLAATRLEPLPIYGVIEDAIAVTQDPWKRNNLDVWKDIFERADLEDIDNFAEFENAMRQIFVQLAWDAENGEETAKQWKVVDLNVAKHIFVGLQWNLGDVGNAHIAEQVDYIRRYFKLITKSKRRGSHHNIQTSSHPPVETESKWNPDYVWIIVGFVCVINVLRLLLEN